MLNLTFLEPFFKKYRLSNSEQGIVKVFVWIVTSILLGFTIYHLSSFLNFLVDSYKQLFNDLNL